MGSEQEFCLKWNNHQNTLVSVFDTLLERGSLVDCTLAAEGQYLKAHKVVLSACSPFFELLLSQHADKHPIVILKDTTFKELKAMIDYIYRGEVNVSQDQLGALLKAAESLQIKGLSDGVAGRGGSAKATPSESSAGDAQTTQAVPRAPAVSTERVTVRSTSVDSVEVAPRPLTRRESAAREGSLSPLLRKRRKHRRRSSSADEGGDGTAPQDGHNEASVSSEQSPPVVANRMQDDPSDVGPAVTSAAQSSEDEDRKPDLTALATQVEPTILPRDEVVPDQGSLSEEVLLVTKSEYIKEDADDENVEDLTLDDDNDLDEMMDQTQPAPLHSGEGSNQGYGPWRFGDDASMASPDAVADTQGGRVLRVRRFNVVQQDTLSDLDDDLYSDDDDEVDDDLYCDDTDLQPDPATINVNILRTVLNEKLNKK